MALEPSMKAVDRPPTLKERREPLGHVAGLGCIVCRNAGLGATPASPDQINCRTIGRKASDFETIPLCPPHHQFADGSTRYQGHIAVHRGPKSFEARYGTEQELLAQTLRDASPRY
jgi:hypothetical protein